MKRMNETFGLYLILTDPVAGYEACAEAAARQGVRYIQLRMKNADDDAFLAMAKRLREITRNTASRLIINDNPRVATQADADGVHLGQDDLSISEARARWNMPGKIFGLSTHDLEQARRALEQQPDYIGIGPVFPTPTKPDAGPALGVAETGRIAASVPITSVAIGGINADNLPALIEAGARKYCVIGAVNSAPDPSAAIAHLQRIWKTHVF